MAATGINPLVGHLFVGVLLVAGVAAGLVAGVWPMVAAEAQNADAAISSEKVPLYKPSSRSPEPLDIRKNSYGATRSAPEALGIGEQAPAFKLPKSGGGYFEFSARRNESDLVIVFYRGHW